MHVFDIKNINMPDDIKVLNDNQLQDLCQTVRSIIIETVSRNGGHLASSLGSVELTVALLKSLDMKKDRIIWDVGHQSYPYKILTGRVDQFVFLRKKDGISGFPKPDESPYDFYATGHSGNSVSAAFGMVVADSLRNEDNKTVAVIGDASFSNGMVFEALNHAGNSGRNLIIVLNDNGRSISKNKGAFARYLLNLRTRMSYYNFKKKVEKFFKHLGFFGKPLIKFSNWMKRSIKAILLPTTLFESLGLEYLGPINGHDINELVSVINRAKKMNKPVLIHAITVKGKGYKPAVDNPENYHGVSGFDVLTGEINKTNCSTFSSVFGDELTRIAGLDKKVCAITAAMTSGTGLDVFKAKYKNRFFDVGIAEEHAVSFSCGLAKAGMKPVFAVYSAFFQRSYDQLLIEAAFQKLPVVFAVDRSGVVGEDGETHQGIFDVAFTSHIPNVSIYCPAYYDELKDMLRSSIESNSVSIIRYPRGSEGYRPLWYKYNNSDDYYFCDNGGILTVTYGRIFSNLAQAIDQLDIPISVLKLNHLKPLIVPNEINKYKQILFFEEGIKTGGISEQFLTLLTENGWKGSYEIVAVDDCFVQHSNVEQALESIGLDTISIKNKIISMFGDKNESICINK